MEILIISPAPREKLYGNNITAERWRSILSSFGHGVTISDSYSGQPADLLVALHSYKSYASIAAFRKSNPGKKIIVALTGTDIYQDLEILEKAAKVIASMSIADNLVVLQPKALEKVPEDHLPKTRVIIQSAVCSSQRLDTKKDDSFKVCVLGHLRDVKDPFRVAEASALLPASSGISVLHAGAAMNLDYEQAAKKLMIKNERYQWLGELGHASAMELIGSCSLMVNSSFSEGGANAVCEAISCGIPVIASGVDGNIGLLGDDYPGYFPVGDTQALADLLLRAEKDQGFCSLLKSRVAALKPMVDPEREKKDWKGLLDLKVTSAGF